MRLILAILLLVTTQAFAAVGDLVGIEIETNGWVARVTASGLNTNGNFFNGFGTNNTITGGQRLTFTVLSPGFNAQGVSQQVARVVYGTKILRAPFPMQNTNDIQPQGGDCVARIALSDYVFRSDVITASALAGYYAVTNGSGTNATAFSNQSVTNSSVLDYPRAIANNAWVQYTQITNRSDNQYAVRVVGRHAYGIAAVHFWGVDESGNRTPTNIVTAPTIDRTMGDPVPIEEYVGWLYYTNMTQGQLVTNFWKAIPNVGVAASILDTSDNVWRAPEPKYCPLLMLCNKTGAVAPTFALVDAANGTANGVVVSNTFNSASPPAPFATIAQAATAIRGTNNGLGHNDVGNGTIYLTNGQHAWLGGSGSYGNRPKTHITITSYPGVGRAAVELFRAANDLDISDVIRLHDISLTVTGANGGTTTFNAIDALWVSNCLIDSSNRAMWGTVTNLYLTHSEVTNCDQGIRSFSTGDMSPTLMRGNRLNNGRKGGQFGSHVACTVIGNERTATNAGQGTLFIDRVTGGNAPDNDGMILAFNNLRYLHTIAGSPAMSLCNSTNAFSHGVAIYNNTIEHVLDNGSGLFSLASNAVGTTNLTNLVFDCNLILGDKTQILYNDSGTAPLYRTACYLRQNIFDDINIKTDDFTSGSGARIGNWAPYFGVGFRGNAFLEVTNIGAFGDFLCTFPGLRAIQNNPPVPVTYPRFTQRGAYNGTAVGAGGGNYRLLSDSPLFRIVDGPTGFRDADGAPRGTIDPPGAFVSGQVQKGAFF